MTRKKPPSLLEAMENAAFSFSCKNGHEFSKTGAWLRRNLVFGCPKCDSDGSTFVHTETMVEQLFNDRIDRLWKLVDQGPNGVTPQRNRNNPRPVWR